MRKVTSLTRNESGFSLIEAMITIGIISITLLMISEMFKQSNNSQTRLERRFEALQAANVLSRSFEDRASCESHLVRDELSSIRTIDLSGSVGSDFVIAGAELDLNEVRPGILGTQVIARPGNILQGSRTGLRVGTTKFKNIKALNAASGLYSGELEITFDVEPPMKPILISQVFRIDNTAGTPSARPMVSCMGSSAPTTPSGNLTYLHPAPVLFIRGQCASAFGGGFAVVPPAPPRSDVDHGVSYTLSYPDPMFVPATAKELVLEVIVVMGGAGNGWIDIMLPGAAYPFPGSFVQGSGASTGTLNFVNIPYHSSRAFNIATNRVPDVANAEDCYIVKVNGYR